MALVTSLRIVDVLYETLKTMSHWTRHQFQLGKKSLVNFIAFACSVQISQSTIRLLTNCNNISLNYHTIFTHYPM